MSEHPLPGPTSAAPTGYRDQPPVNGLAIAALVVAFFSGLVGLILGIVAHRQIRRDGTRGSGLAVAAIVIGAVRLLVEIPLGIILAIGLFTGSSDVSVGGSASAAPEADQFAPGTCAGSDDAGSLQTVGCGEPHSAEVVGTAVGDLTTDAGTAAAAAECGRQVDQLAIAGPDLPAHTDEAIPLGDNPSTTAACLVLFAGTVTGSVVDGTLAAAS